VTGVPIVLQSALFGAKHRRPASSQDLILTRPRDRRRDVEGRMRASHTGGALKFIYRSCRFLLIFTQGPETVVVPIPPREAHPRRMDIVS
jgi:hypothetical protein